MKSLAEKMRNHDREQMSRMAHNLPEQYQERAPVEQVAQVFNGLFNQLRAAFPASMANFRTQDDLNEFRRQWLLAFQENGIHTMAQVDAGMRVARRQERPFLPSPGQFVAWCKQSGGMLGITVDQVITEYRSISSVISVMVSSGELKFEGPKGHRVYSLAQEKKKSGRRAESVNVICQECRNSAAMRRVLMVWGRVGV